MWQGHLLVTTPNCRGKLVSPGQVSDEAGGSYVFRSGGRFFPPESRILGWVSGAPGEKLFWPPLWHEFIKNGSRSRRRIHAKRTHSMKQRKWTHSMKQRKHIGTIALRTVVWNFLYLIFHDFRKIIGRTKILENYTSGAVAHDVWSSCRRGPRR
jgi:hypothetical protein